MFEPITEVHLQIPAFCDRDSKSRFEQWRGSPGEELEALTIDRLRRCQSLSG